MTVEPSHLNSFALEFRALPQSITHLLARHDRAYYAATTDAERNAALVCWRDEIANMKDIIDGVIGDFDAFANEVEEAAEDRAREKAMEQRAAEQHGMAIFELQEAFEFANLAGEEEHAVIVFTSDSFGVANLPEVERSYRVSSRCSGFGYEDGEGLCGAIVGTCLADPEQAPVRLDLFMRIFDTGEDKEFWQVDYCYRLDAGGHRIYEDFERSHD